MTATWTRTGGKSWRVVFEMPPSEKRLVLTAPLGGLNAYRTVAATMVQGYLGANARAQDRGHYEYRSVHEQFIEELTAPGRGDAANMWVRGVSENSESRPENSEKADRVPYSRPGWAAYLAPGTPQR